MKPTQVLAIIATSLIVVTGVNYLLRPPPRPDGLAKKSQASKTKKPAALASCKITRAVFGGTESALLRVTKGHVVHYVVLDLPTDNPLAPAYQSNWLEANYGSAEPALIGVFSTVDAAVDRAAGLCKRN
jgi:hypothetical protein